MSEHAPGPWHVNGRQIKCVDHGRYYRIATVYNPMFTAAANEANAKLIAAAPKMFDALTKIATWWMDTPGFKNGEDEMPAEVFDAMMGAIRSAQ